MLARINKILFWGLLVILIVSSFTRKSLKTIDEISPRILRQPYQARTYSRPIVFEKDGYKFEVKPLYNYVIDGLVVSKITYKFFSIYKNESIFPVDIALLWGSNIENKIFKAKTIKFEQDMRWVFVKCSIPIKFNPSEISNNHLLINDPRLEKIALSLCAGDQVSIKGKLVNVVATNLKNPSNRYAWNTSTSRHDSASGACEVIYVEDIKILKKGNILSHILFAISFWGLIILIVFNILKFFIGF